MVALAALAATAAAVAKVGMKTANGQSIEHGIWVLVILIASGMIGAWRIWLKNAPERLAAKAAAEAASAAARLAAETADRTGEAQLRSEMWKDIEKLKQAKEDQSRRLTMAETQIAGQTIRLGQQAFVITMLLDEIERISPGNTIARSARALINMQADQMPNAEEIAPMADIMAKLCVEPEEGKAG